MKIPVALVKRIERLEAQQQLSGPQSVRRVIDEREVVVADNELVIFRVLVDPADDMSAKWH